MGAGKDWLTAYWLKEHKCSNWLLLGMCIGLFFLGYIVGEHRTQRKWEASLEKMLKTDVFPIQNRKISLGLTEEKREEILDAMQDAKEERESDYDRQRR